MSFLSDTFSKVFGKPTPAVPPGLTFAGPNLEWESVKSEVGCGWFLNRFLYLFGEGLDELLPCLDAWSFVVPPADGERQVIGRNAYGALLVLENGSDPKKQKVYLLDPVQVQYWTHPQIVLLNLCGNYLPRGRIPGFIDHAAYDKWIKANGDVALERRDILGVKKPIPLGGKLEPANLQLEDVVTYYQTTAPIYAKAYAELYKQGPK
jgi:hypothetical protein